MSILERETFRSLIRDELPELLREDELWRREVAAILYDVFAPLQEIRDILARWDRRAARLEEGHAQLEEGHFHLEQGYEYVVERFEVMDEAGQVHGVPALVEIDLVVRDGDLWLVEIKGRVSGNDLYTFMRKVRFYEAHTGHSPSRRIIIAPLIEDPALARARQEGIECYAAEDELEIE